jgi:hypothetical protein
MEIITDDSCPNSNVSYEDAPIAEAAIDGVEYRVDAGRGAAVAISRRESGTWAWQLAAEGRWDGLSLRVKELDQPTIVALADALKHAMNEQRELCK